MPERLDSASEASAQATRKNAAGRLLAVLDAFGPRSRALSLSEISRRSELSLSTTHRLVHELLSWGALERDPNGRYSIGVRLLELAALAPRGLDLREAAFPCLDELHHRTRGNVHLAVRDGMQVVYVEVIRACATHPTSGKAGDRWPMHATGTGLVLLAFADRELQEEALQRPLERYTPLTITDPAQLRRKLAQVRQSGYAVSVGQITLPDLVVAVGRPLQPGQQPGQRRFVDRTEEGQRDMPRLPACPAQVAPSGTERGCPRVQLVQDVWRRCDRDEQPHDLTRS